MRYELDFTGYKRGGFESLPLRAIVKRRTNHREFANVQEAQEFCYDPFAMLAEFDADYGKFALRCGERPYEWEWVWEFRFDRDAVNHMPLDYRVWRSAIFNAE